MLTSDLAINLSSPKSTVVAEIYGQLNIALIRSIARTILSRELTLLTACACVLVYACVLIYPVNNNTAMHTITI